LTITLTILLYFVQPSGETFTQAEQQRAVQSITQAADWWHARRGDVFDIQVQGMIDPMFDPFVDWQQLQAAPRDKTIVVFVVDNSQGGRALQCGAVQALGCSTWHAVYLLNTDKPWIPAHEIGHALYLLPDLNDGIDIMNPWAARAAYEQDTIGCVSLAALGAPCNRTYLPLMSN
jgi:hypothetical protein